MKSARPAPQLGIKNLGITFNTLRKLLKFALLEDGAWHDRTTQATISPQLWARGEIRAKESGVLAGIPLVKIIYQLLDPRCKVTALKQEGVRFKKDEKVAVLLGPSRALLSGERLSLNFLSRLSGVATLTRQFSDQVGQDRIYDTRKTTPLLRSLERYAVRVGRGNNHRFNLAGHVLIKDNHLNLGGGVTACVKAARKKYGLQEFIEVEVENLKEALEAVESGADIILVDNASPKLFHEIIKKVRGRIQIETSGGLTLKNIRRYAKLPVDRFSSGSLTHSAPSIDFSMALFPKVLSK